MLVLTEDSATDALATVKSVVQRVFGILVAGYQFRHVEVEPPDAVLRTVLRANRWKEFDKNRQLQSAYGTLINTIATRVLQDNGLVVFHFDGDRRWSEHDQSENVAKFDQFIRLPVRRAVMTKSNEPDARLARLFTLVPFYSLEAWLFQNSQRAIEICRARYRGADVGRFEHWRDHPGELDEVIKVKEETCLRSHHNHELAQGLDADVVYGVGKSLAASVAQMLDCDPLTSALKRTRATVERP